MPKLYFAIVLPLALSLSVFAVDQGVDPAALPSLAASNEPPAPTAFTHPEALLDPAALAKLLDTPGSKVVLLDARDDGAFKLGHIPGARNLQSDLFQDPQRPPFFMPPPEAIKRIAAQEGIDAATRLVVYDEEDGRLAARIWFTFHAHGHEHVSILNGGAAKWRAEHKAKDIDRDRGWSAELPPFDGRGTFEPLVLPRNVCAFEDLPRYRMRVQSIGKLPPVALLDARSRAEFQGEDSKDKNGGHIPGAANVPWTSVLSGKEGSRAWKSPQEIHALLRVIGVDKNVPIAIYDQAGGRSAHVYFTLWLLGFSELKNYVGGWRDYSARAGIEIEK